MSVFTCTPNPNPNSKAVTFQNLDQFSITLTRDGVGGVTLTYGPVTITCTEGFAPPVATTLNVGLSFNYEVDTGGTVVSEAIEIISPWTATPNNSVLQGTNVPLQSITPTGTIQNMTFVVTVASSIIGPPIYVDQVIGTVTGTFVNCFAEGTLISVPGGTKAIETFKAGDVALASDGSVVSVLKVSNQSVLRGMESARMFRVPAGRFGAQHNFLVSKWHKILTEEGWLEAYRIGLEEVEMPESYQLYHISVENGASLLAGGGCVVESWSGAEPVPSPGQFSVKEHGFVKGRDHLRHHQITAV